MMSTFMGLETSKRGLNTSQSALYTTGNNVSNANTKGYTRQRVNLVQTSGFPSVGRNSPMIPGHLGTGVTVESVQRVRESFLDDQYRTQSSKNGYYGTLTESLTKMEGIMNDPTDSGLAKTMEDFWGSLQELTLHSENSGARAVVGSTAETVASTLNYYATSLENIQKDIGYQIGVKTEEVNTIINNISRINQEIGKIEPNGYIPNALYDERDVLVDDLSKLMNIKVTHVIPENYGNANKAVATGLYKIELVGVDGEPYGINLIDVNGETGETTSSTLEVDMNEDPKVVNDVQVDGMSIGDLNFSGELAALITSYGFNDQGGIYPDMLQKLNAMAKTFASEFNAIHQKGYDLNGNAGGEFFTNFDTENPAKTIAVSTEILANPSLIAAGSESGASGDNGNAHNLANIKFTDFTNYESGDVSDGLTGTFDSYYAGVIGQLGVDSAGAQKDDKNTQTLLASVDQNRQSMSAVSLDEEMTDMVKYQQAYNASARMMTVMDEILDKIINGMGTVGR